MSFPGSIYPAQYYPSFGSFTTPSHVSCWGLVGATAMAWGPSGGEVLEPWAVLTANTYSNYCLGENFTIVANEEFPMIASEEQPLTVPPDSGFSSP